MVKNRSGSGFSVRWGRGWLLLIHGQKSLAGWYEKLGFEQDEGLVKGFCERKGWSVWVCGGWSMLGMGMEEGC